MKYAENNRVSHRQLYRQMILAFLAPFLLCLFGEKKVLGPLGVLGTAAAVVLLLFYVIFLIRLAPYFGDLKRCAGNFMSRVIGIFFLSYVLLTAAYLLHVLEEVVSISLLTGFSGRWITFLAAAVCSMGAHKGIQKRGRMAEVSGGLFLFVIAVMMLLCLGQAKWSYLREMTAAFPGTAMGFLRCGYGVLCALSGIGFLPFVLENVEKAGSAWKPAALGILTVGGILLGMLFLLPAVFGWKRLLTEPYPVLPLLAGADLPGNVLARFDVLWMGFLLYGLLFSVGSLFYYGNQVIRKTDMGSGRYWMAAAAYVLSFWKFGGAGIEDYFGYYLGYVFVPGLLVIQLFLVLWRKERRKKKMAAAAGILSLMLLLGGCSGIEPEKRMYPLALGADGSDGIYTLIYGMPDLPKATGGEKQEEGKTGQVLKISGSDFDVIEAAYNRSQEKYLDMGHLEVLILSRRLLESDQWEGFLAYLRQEKSVGENVYVFWAEDVENVLTWSREDGTSAGEYLTGILENRTTGQQKEGVTLREVYHEWYRNGNYGVIPEVRTEGGNLEIIPV